MRVKLLVTVPKIGNRIQVKGWEKFLKESFVSNDGGTRAGQFDSVSVCLCVCVIVCVSGDGENASGREGS